MRSRMLGVVLAAVLCGVPLWGLEEIRMGNLDSLARKAKESVDVTLDASMLQLASGFLSSEDPDEARVKKLVSKLKGVYVRSFEFDKEGQYSMSDVDAVRAQVRGSGWSRIVGVKSMNGENSEVYLKKDGGQLLGIVVIAAEPKELTVVDIDGPISPEELSELGGHLGIPKWHKNKTDKGSSKGDQ
jgi:Domain of unknown function (DUF4252)